MYTTQLFEAVNAYMIERAAAREEFLLCKQQNEKARGSALYDEVMGEARSKREKRIDAAQAIARQAMAAIIPQMVANAEAAKMSAPSDEQLRILSLLRMREHVTQAELDSAAAAMGGNGAALAVLDELARKNEILVQPYSRLATAGLTADQSKAALNTILNGCRQIIENRTGATRAALLAKEHHERLYGGSTDPDELAQEPIFKDEFAFYEKVSPVPINLLSQAID